jgi:hypothetical protein
MGPKSSFTISKPAPAASLASDPSDTSVAEPRPPRPLAGVFSFAPEASQSLGYVNTQSDIRAISFNPAIIATAIAKENPSSSMMLMARRKGRSPGVAARRGCSVGGVECLATPRRELDSHSLNRATYTVAWKFRRSDKLAQQEKSSRNGSPTSTVAVGDRRGGVE